MPRRDGFPTNREMVVDFNTLSRTAYIDAYNHMTADGMPAAFEDKPLDALYLNVIKNIPAFMRTSDSVTDEQLVVEPLQEDHADFMTSIIGFQDIPEDIVEHYRNIARRIGETTLHSGLDIVSVLPPEGINADYTAYYPSGRTRHISTFKEKPSKPSIAAGKFFAAQAVQSITTQPDRTTLDILDFSQVVGHMKNIAEQGGVFDHDLLLRMVPDLPLNGHESKAFLNVYANRMFDRATYNAARLAKVKDLGAPEIIIESIQHTYDAAHNAYLRAQALLDKK
jgi:hypothetical protein